jgi:predicted TIM-barrel fold metal-dependent hydrolase
LRNLTFALVLLAGSGWAQPAQPAISFESMEPIDAHAHLQAADPGLLDMLNRRHLRIVNICVVDKYDRGYEEAEPQHAKALEIFRGSRGQVPWCSTFDPEDWESPGFADRAIQILSDTFADGAIAVKIYKSIGMNLKSRKGEYLMPDNPVFDSIFKFLVSRNKTVYAHIAEPEAAWLPLDPASPDYGYYKENPAWHMYGHPERPDKETILSARDKMLKRNPKLRVVGCHLGSMEKDVQEIAKRLDRYPNFAVDTSGRVEHLMLQPRDKVRAFLLKYSDRVLYATDLSLMPWDDPVLRLKDWEGTYDRDWKFFSTGETLQFEGKTLQGLALPTDVLRKLYHENVVRWVPGVLEGK